MVNTVNQETSSSDRPIDQESAMEAVEIAEAPVEVAEAAETAGPADAAEPEEPAQDQAGPAIPERELVESKATIDALADKLVRLQADFENYRKRAAREKTEYHQKVRAEVLLELLPVLDNFERALASLESADPDPDALHQGVDLIHRQFKDALAKFGLQPLSSVGQSFDPHLHEAITIEQTDEHEENTVLEEFQRGYMLGDKLLRPAKVKVAASPAK